MKKILFLLAIAGIAITDISFASAIACTQEAKMCADGSAVSRTGPNCEFALCPTDTNPKVCTQQYAPVCAEIQIQCIKAPCNPIKQTFSNACEMNSNSLARLAYPGACLAPSNETSLGNALVDAIVQYTGFLSDVNRVATILERVVSRSDVLAQNQVAFSVRQSAYRFVSAFTRTYLQEKIYTPYIEKHISDISTVQAVLGWTWHVTNIKWIEPMVARVNYEDGHIAEVIDIEFSMKDSIINVQVN